MHIDLEPIGLRFHEEGRITVTDGEAFSGLLREYSFQPSGEAAIRNALNGEHGVDLLEFVALFMNATVEKAASEVSRMARYVSCTYQPGCNSGAGHDGECDLDVPF